MRRALFVCTGNRARGQMAGGLLRHLAVERFEVYSAGTAPNSVVPLTVAGTQLHWDVEDPADAETREVPQADAFRTARDDLRRRIEQFGLTYREETP